ncbi:glutaredoxin family protein [Virgibacillus siamensis]|uniref:glutaredoxin family protein n=1 Tax=Virgibacillus siamensis TaxID=480071 RepID=UPI0009864287|nr:glutaredoxin family protein [Virgibacillus siamensis]
MHKLIFYTKENCPLCDDAKVLLDLLRPEYPFEMEERDIYTKDDWLEKYQLMIPVVQINDIMLDCEQITYDSLETALKKSN